VHGVETALARWAGLKAEQGFGPRQKEKEKIFLDFSNPFQKITNLWNSKSNLNFTQFLLAK
jgi:hypothetical protein